MKAWDRRGLIEDALARALDDWLHIGDLVSIAKRTGVATAEGLRAVALGLIADMLCTGLLIAGDADEFGFHAWEVSTGEALCRIVDAWSQDELSPTPGAVAWFAHTSRGEEVGRSVLARERS